jgi:hypothetical protein
MAMTMLEILRAMDRGETLKLSYDNDGNFWIIAGEKCTGLVNRLIKRRFVKVVEGKDVAYMTDEGHKHLIKQMYAGKLKEGK